MDLFDIYIRSFAAGEGAAEGVARTFRVDERRALELIRALPRVVKRRITAEEAARYQVVLGELGADFEMRPSPILPARIIAVEGGADAADDKDDVSGYALTLPPPSEARAQGQTKAQPVLGSSATWVTPADALRELERIERMAVEAAAHAAAAEAAAAAAAAQHDESADRTDPGHEPDWEALGVSRDALSAAAQGLPAASAEHAAAARERGLNQRLVGMVAPTLPSFGTMIEAPKGPAPEAARAPLPAARHDSSAPRRGEPTQPAHGDAAFVPAAPTSLAAPAPHHAAAAPSHAPAPSAGSASPWESAPLHPLAHAAPALAPPAPASAPRVSVSPPSGLTPPAFGAPFEVERSPMAITGWSKPDHGAGFDFSQRPAWLADDRAIRDRMQDANAFGADLLPRGSAPLVDSGASLPGAEFPPLELDVPHAAEPPVLPSPSARPPAPLLPGDPMAAVLGGGPPRAKPAAVRPSSGAPPRLHEDDASPLSHPPPAMRPVSRMPPAARHSVEGARARRYSAEREPLPLALRVVWRGVAGVALFGLALFATHCHPRGSAVELAMREWQHRPPPAPEGVPEGQKGRFGPFAGPWLDHSTHQVADGDKDAARSRINDFILAGAPQVYVGETIRSGPVEIATELIVEMPSEPDKRARVLAIYQAYLDGRGGGQADANAQSLRVALN